MSIQISHPARLRLLLGLALCIWLAFAQSTLPTVNLGYGIYRASLYDVWNPLHTTRSLEHLTDRYSLLANSIISQTFDMPNLLSAI